MRARILIFLAATVIIGGGFFTLASIALVVVAVAAFGSNDIILGIFFIVAALLMLAFAILFIRTGIRYLKDKTSNHATDVLVAFSFLIWIALFSKPGTKHFDIFGFEMPYSVLSIAAAYILYRLLKTFILGKTSNEKN